MVRKKYTEEQIIAVLTEAEAGAKTADLCRKYGMSDATAPLLDGRVKSDHDKKGGICLPTKMLQPAILASSMVPY